MNDIYETLYLVRLFIYVELGITAVVVLFFVGKFAIRFRWKRFFERLLCIPKDFVYRPNFKSNFDKTLDDVYECLGDNSERMEGIESRLFAAELALNIRNKPKKKINRRKATS